MKNSDFYRGIKYLFGQGILSVMLVVVVLLIGSMLVTIVSGINTSIQMQKHTEKKAYVIPQENRAEFNARYRFYIGHCGTRFGQYIEDETCNKIHAWLMSASGIGGDFPLQNAPKPLLE